MAESLSPDRYSRSLRRHTFASFVLITALFGGSGYWASQASIHGAVVAPGRFVVETNVKRVQHADGGYVAEILVKEGEAVEQGDLLIRLDDTLLRADLAITTAQLNEAVLTEARLLAQQLGEETFQPPRADLVLGESEAAPERLVLSQLALLKASRRSVESQKKQLKEQVSQLEEKIEGLSAQRDAASEEILLTEDELGKIEGLLKNGLITQERVKDLQRENARLSGERGRLVAAIAEARLAMSEKEVQILRVDDEEQASILQQLQEVRLKKNSYAQQRLSYLEHLQRLDITAPQAGIVHELAAHTLGGVVKPGEVIISIVPGQDVLIVEGRIDPRDIDQVHVGQPASIRLTSLDQRVTPKVPGKVASISPDIAVDPATQTAYYKARFTLNEGQTDRIPEHAIVAGMPVEVFITTHERTVMAFLVQPLTEHFARTFLEQ